MEPDFSQEVQKTVQILRKGGTILYPTDTIWGIGCDATHNEAVEKVLRIKHRMEAKSLIILVDRFEEIPKYVMRVPDIAMDLIRVADKPLTIIYSQAKNLASNVIARDGSIAIRVVNHPFCQALLKAFGKPIVSTSANVSGEPSPILYSKISEEIKREVDHIVELDKNTLRQMSPSRIIRIFDNGQFQIIRD
ncbi:MAG: threonylcarbamoyl-AMP synthase [Bacteroidetes bacterium]|nr:threonylcarbamoyl-AMP synthase [Bacteroidota bacterium]